MNNCLANKIETKEWAWNMYEYETSETLNEKPKVLNMAPTASKQKLVYGLCKIAYFPYIKALFGLYNLISASSASFGL